MTGAFTIWDAEFALYPEAGGGQIFTGGCAERMDVSRRIEQLALRYPGRAWAKRRDVDEEHSIGIQNVWSWRSNAVPELDRAARYALVVRWWDEDRATWAKVTFFGVTLADDKLEGEAVMQTLNLQAERRSPIAAGRHDLPDLLPQADIVPAEVWYFNGVEALKLYGYDDATGGLVAVADTDGRASIAADGTELVVAFAGTEAVRVKADGAMHTHGLILGVQAYLGTLPRIEFLRGTRCAAIGADGSVACRDAFEADTASGASGDIALSAGGHWRLTIAQAGISAASFVED